MSTHDTTITALFRDRVRASPDKVALRHKKHGIWHDVTWGAYGERARHVAAGFLSLGLKKGECVAISSENRPEWVYADLGAMCAGGMAAGVYTTNAPEQCGYIVKHSGARFYVAENIEQYDKAVAFRAQTPTLEKVIVVDTEGLTRSTDPMYMSFDAFLQGGKDFCARSPGVVDSRCAEVKPDDLALLIYTSGTTGPPKGAMLTHKNLAWMAEALSLANPIRESDETLSYLPLCHIFEQLFTVLANVRHATVVNFVENTDTAMDNMREVSPTIAYGVPRVWEKYLSGVMIRMSDATFLKRAVFKAAMAVGLRHAQARLGGGPAPFWVKAARPLAWLTVFRPLKKRLGFDRARVAYTGAAPISPDVIKFFHAIGLPMVEGYGQTESTGVTAVGRPDRMKLGTVGLPLPGVEVKIDEDGEILVKGPGIFAGYYSDPDATAAALDGEWLRSGDVGEIDGDGFLKITDRKKDLIITAGGKNIAPQNIENRLKFSPYITDAVAIGDRKKFMAALIVLDEENVVKFAKDNRVPFTTYASLTRAPEVIALVQREVDAVNKTLSNVEAVKKFAIIPKKLYEEDGEVTPTMKVKRKSINAAYKTEIDAMYR
ncbi:MAG: AMP-binding protein [Deltaproteobacteria bacterium]|nr:AMP-binding protein [Deltaproteobacteria bacterium]